MFDEEFNHAEAILDAMKKYGGSFVKSLSECFRRADPRNFEKLKNAFPEYWKEYEEWANKDAKKNNQDKKSAENPI